MGPPHWPASGRTPRSGAARHFRHHPDDGDRDGSGFPRVWPPDRSGDRAFTCQTRCGDATLHSRLQQASVQVTTALADVTAFVLLLAITAYSVAGGVDYGAGIWDILAGRGPTAERARQLIDHAMAPVWEANISVWQACFNPTSISFGLVSLAATAFIGASFLVGDARRFGQPDMVEYFRRRAVISTAVLIVIGTIALAAIGLENPHLLNAMLTGLGTPFAAAAVIVTPLVGFLLWRRILRWYRLLSVVVVGSLVFAWGFAQSPYLLPGQLTITQSAAPLGSDVLLSIVSLLVVVLVLPSLALLVYLDQRGELESPEA